MFEVLNCIVTEHDHGLVALAAIICGLGCFTTVTLVARADDAADRKALGWLIAAALVFSFSVWVLHFVAMIAFLPAQTVGYEIGETLLSLVIVCAGAVTAGITRRMWRPNWLVALASGIAVGGGVTGMHYVGVAAMRYSGLKIFDPLGVAASIGLVMAFSWIAFMRGGRLRQFRQRLEAACWFAIAICSLHFTGMAALALTPGEATAGHGVVLATSEFALIVGAATILLLIAFLVSLLIEQQFSNRVVREYTRMRLLSNLAHETLLITCKGVILEINNAGERLFETKAANLISKPLDSVFAPESLPAMARRWLCPPTARLPEEVSVLTSSGRSVAVELSCQPIDYRGEPATAIALRDLTDRNRDQARILYLARHDPVTGLPNRYSLQERLDAALLAESDDPAAVAVLYIDLDQFKAVNDIHGHAIGDALLKQAAERMTSHTQHLDFIARVGGDEFVILLQADDPAERSAAIAGNVLRALREPFAIEGNQIEIGASIGIALYPADGDNADAILRAADIAMYRAKEEGRNAVRYFESAMDAQLQARRAVEEDLRKALGRNELFLHYQPMVSCQTGEVESFEALVRWKHPQRGLVSPGEFIPIAETTGLITPIGEWVIDEACREASSWPQPWRVSVNVSPIQMRQSDICAIVQAALERHKLPADRLIIEITESVLIHNAVQAVATLNTLRKIGVRLALDDFGTGYSSLSYLQKFKFDKFKIDKSFIDRLGDTPEALSIVTAITTLGHNLGLEVVAEGVETEAQLALLRALGCDKVQGYLLGRPRAVTGLTDLDFARIRAFWTRLQSRVA